MMSALVTRFCSVSDVVFGQLLSRWDEQAGVDWQEGRRRHLFDVIHLGIPDFYASLTK